MARWGKGRGTSLAVPLDNLFKENINCPSVARSAGVVGKWGITSFTSLRSAPYAFSSQYVKSQVQDQNSPLTVPVPTTADEAPKPKKFFKSRNTVPDAPPEGSQAGAVSSAPEPPKASTLFHRRDDKPKSAGAKKASKASVKEIPPDKEDIPKLKIHIDKSKNSKKAFATKASKKEDTTTAEVAHLSPNKRYLVRNRNKIINYSEDRSNSPLLPEEIALLTRESPPKTVPPLKVSPPKISPPLSSPTYVKPGLMSPTNKEGKPPIVLRISKGTSRLLSTDSEDVLASPNSDRHSISEPHFDEKPSPVPVIGSPPKQEGIKITIKLDTKSKKHEKEDKPSRSMRASKRSHHKTNEEKAEIEEKMARVGSPVPGSDNYELYRTLASPVRADVANQTKNEEPELGDVETALENLHAVAEPPIPKLIMKDSNANLSSKIDTSPPPEPKPPERRTGRTMRNRLNVNYNEDNNFLDEVTTLRHSKNAAKIFSKKSKRKEERNHEIASSATAETIDSKSDDELLQTLSEGSEPIRLNNEATASKRSHKKSSQSPMSDDNEPLVLKISHKKFNQSPRSEDNKALILRKSHKKSSQSPRSEDNEPLILKKSHKKSSQSPQSEDNEPLILKKTHKKSPRNEDNEPLILRKSHRKSSPRRSPSDDNEPLALKKSRKTLDQSPPSDDNEPLVLKKTHKKSSQSPQSEDNAELPENRIQSPRRSERQARSPEKIVFKSPKRICESGNSDNDEKPSVKLVIMKKKGSIFKTRAPVNEGGPMAAVKKRQLYKHKWADDGKGGQTPRREPEAEAAAAAEAEAAAAAPGAPGAEAAEAPLARVTRFRPEADFGDDAPDPYTSVRCHRGAKEYYTVVRNVKKAHQIQEIGEFQEFNDDVEYILDALQDNNPMATRCLSAITLASKCTAPAFRMHVRAHGTVQKFFRALHDATNDQSLGLCTATVMFVLSQDRLNMDLDRESLELMLNLLESDVSHKNALDDCGLTLAQLDKNKERVRELCAEIKNEGKAKHLDLENITVGNLAMETLLSLTSKRAGEWFKEELRSLGGIDHIVRTIRDCCAAVGFQRERPAPVAWAPHLLDTLRKADRCMKVLENVTQQNEENQMYLVRSGGDSQCVATLARLYCACLREARRRPEPPVLAALTDTLLPTLKVLVNLSHSFSSNREVIGSGVVGEQPGVFNTSIALLTEGHKIIPDDLDFEFSVCVLLLLINLVQNNTSNVQRLLETVYTEQDDADSKKPIIEALIDQFYKREELARLAEQNTNDILDGEKEDEPKEKKMSHDDIIEETVAKLLQKAGVHMEHTMVGSYIVLLLGHIASTGEELELKVRQMLPTHGFEQMRATLTKYSSFLNLTASGEASSVAHIKATQKIMDFLNRSDKLHDDLQSQDQVSSSSNLNETQSPASHLSPDRLNCSAASNNPPSEYNTTSDSDRMSTSMDLDTSFS